MAGRKRPYDWQQQYHHHQEDTTRKEGEEEEDTHSHKEKKVSSLCIMKVWGELLDVDEVCVVDGEKLLMLVLRGQKSLGWPKRFAPLLEQQGLLDLKHTILDGLRVKE